MSGSHTHSHTTNYNRAFKIGIILNLAFVIIQAMFGFFSNSLALLADAGHNLGDVMGLAIAWGASYLSSKPPTIFRTYGYKRSSILAAFLNALILLITVGAIFLESLKRIKSPEQVNGYTVIIVAAVGVIINGATAMLFMSGIKKDLNIKGAFLHMASDAAVSIGVVISGIIILKTNLLIMDPVVGILIAVVITFGTFGLLKESFNMATDAVPSAVDYTAVRDFLKNYDGVKSLHDLHIWNISTTDIALTVHIVLRQNKVDNKYISDLSRKLKEKFDIVHSTVQIENCDTETKCDLAAKDII
ncbi:MAG TPA: cation diffusion facilitator family transporter [Ignavibacteria bacterium]|nr:cation diffusion facilitator family transporter [Ignavibacteria bacterium]